MRRYEREVDDPILIHEMLKLFDTVNLGLNDEDGVPYVVPLNFGYEMDEKNLYVYIHCAKKGHKIDLIKKDNRVCLMFSAFHDFPDRQWKKHRHDYRSVIAKGTVELLDGSNDYETFKKGYDLLYLCNNREIVPLESRPVIPPIYIGKITCPMSQVSAKSEFPLRKVEDVPFTNVYDMPDDDTPFDLSDIIAKKKLAK